MTTATVSQRITAYLIDLAPVVFVGFVMAFVMTRARVPAVWMISPQLVFSAYFLLRDVTGASPGKAALGLRVMARAGGESSMGQRVLRNVVFVLGPVVASVPVLNIWIVNLAVFVATLSDLLFLLVNGERISDKMAGTIVVHR